jgi:hypothetical protein
MKTTIKVEKEVDIKTLKMDVAVRYDEEDMPKDFPFRTLDIWSVFIDIDTGQIENWPQGIAHSFYMKVCDQGSYYLLDQNRKCVASIENDYVPNSLVPGSYGDYIEFDIQADGKIKNWKKHPSFEDFFPDTQ